MPQYEDEIAMIIIGIIAVIALVYNQTELASAALGFIGGYLIKAFKDHRV